MSHNWFKKLLCSAFGHWVINIDTENFTAECGRCRKKLKVSYDMKNGETIVEGEIKNV